MNTIVKKEDMQPDEIFYYDSIVKKCNDLIAKIHFARLINTKPLAIMFVTGFISICLSGLVFKFTEWPSFSDPKVGFETRGTELSGRVLTYRNLGKELSIYPDISKRFFRQIYSSLPDENLLPEYFDRKRKRRNEKFKHNSSTSVSGFCNDYAEHYIEADQYVQLVFEASDSEKLFSVPTLTELCKFQDNILPYIAPLQKDETIGNGYFWSLPNYVACLTGSHSCMQLNVTKLQTVKTSLKHCAPFRYALVNCFHSLERHQWTQAYLAKTCTSIPIECKSKQYYDLFNYLLSKNTFNDSTNMDSVYTIFVLPVKNMHYLHLLGLKNEETLKSLTTLHTKIMGEVDNTLTNGQYVGHFFGIKLDIFSRSFLDDSIQVLIGLALVSLVVWFYSGSIFYMCSVILTLVFSVGVTYFVYRLVFRLNFFPFINLLVVATLVGVGGDDTFVLRHIFDLYKKHGLSSISENDVGEALSNAALSMFVTSMTTAAALYSLLISDIMTIKCFGVFAGTMMLMNYLLAVSWLPACLVVLDKYIDPLYRNMCIKQYLISSFKLFSMFSLVTDYIFVSRIIPWLIIKLKYLWLALLSGLFIAAAYVVFVYPALSLPDRDSNMLQVFKDNNPFEWYVTNAEKYFQFYENQLNRPIDIAVVWGLKPIDNARSFNPDDTGSIVLDNSFKITMATLQAISYTCENLDDENITSLQTHRNCFPTQFISWSIEQRCNGSNMEDICCNYVNEYFHDSHISHCLAEFTLQKESEFGHPIFDSDAYFNEKRYKVVGLVIYFDSSFNKTHPYSALGDFYKEVDRQFHKTLMESIGDEYMQHAWFVTANYDTIAWYDLETSLLKKTPQALVLSVAFTLVVVVFTLKAVLLSFLSMITILAVIIVTVACMILLKWQLNIVESTIFVMVVGLGMDLTTHFAVGYKLAPSGTREEKVYATLAYIGIPVAMCSLTTFLAGCSLCRVSTLAYYETGLFMIIHSIVSWLYANFFFLPLLSVCGPQDIGFTSWTLKDILIKAKDCILYCSKKHKPISVHEMRSRNGTTSTSSEAALC